MVRSRSSAGNNFVDMVARLPWWGAVVLAVGFYLLFHSVAQLPDLNPAQPAKAGVFVQAALVYWFATIFQYLVPGLCLMAGRMSFLGRRRRQQLVNGVATSTEAKPLDGITWREFEMLVGEAFRMEGYTVLETGGGGEDGGVDLVLRKPGGTYLVQCKQWKAQVVPVTVVRELYGVMAHHTAAGARAKSSHAP